MSEMALEFDVTRADLDGMVRAALREWRRSWVQRAATLLMLVGGVALLPSSRWWLGILLLLVAADRWFHPVFAIMMRRALRTVGPYRVRVTLDDHSLRYEALGQRGAAQRYWWRNLKGVREDDAGIELDFGFGARPQIPSRAFRDEEQRAEVRAFVAQRRSARVVPA